MAQVSANIPRPDDVATAATTNSVFSAFGAVSVDAYNVGSEGVDLRTFSAVAADKPVVVKVMYTSGTTVQTIVNGYDYAAGVGGGYGHQAVPGMVLDLSASPFVLLAGDLIRIPWAVHVIGRHTTVKNYDHTYVWLVTPTWDITSAALANYEILPGNNDLHRTWTTLRTSGIILGGTTAYSVAPLRVDWAGGGGGSQIHTRYSICRSWNRVHSGASVTVYGIRLEIAGPFHTYHYDSGVGFTEDVYQAYGAAPGEDDLDISNRSLALVVMRGGA